MGKIHFSLFECRRSDQGAGWQQAHGVRMTTSRETRQGEQESTVTSQVSRLSHYSEPGLQGPGMREQGHDYLLHVPRIG